MSIIPPSEENHRPYLDERDACALIANVRKQVVLRTATSNAPLQHWAYGAPHRRSGR